MSDPKPGRGKPLKWCLQCRAFHADFPCPCVVEIQRLKEKVTELRGKLADMATLRESKGENE